MKKKSGNDGSVNHELTQISTNKMIIYWNKEMLDI
jgi:hypothetical protein